MLWGLAMVWVIEKIENTKWGQWLPRHQSRQSEDPVIEYHI